MIKYRTSESRRKIDGNLTGDAILGQVLADYVHTRIARHSSTEIRLVIGRQTREASLDMI